MTELRRDLAPGDRRMNLDPLSDAFIPSARHCVIAQSGRDGAGRYRTHCNACLDERPLTDASDVYGSRDGDSDDGACDACGRTLAALSAVVNAARDAQQARWARDARVESLVEIGAAAGVRCRVY